MGDIVIYGAGSYAKEFYKTQEFLGRADKIDFFVVSEKSDEEKIGDKQIFSLAEKENQLYDKKIVIAVSAKFSHEIIERISKIEVKSIIQISSYDYKNYKTSCIDLARGMRVIHNKVLIILDKKDNLLIGELNLWTDSFSIVLCSKNDDVDEAVCNDNIKLIKYDSSEYYRDLATAGVVVANFFLYVLKRCEQCFIYLNNNQSFVKLNENEVNFYDKVCSIKRPDDYKKLSSYIFDVTNDPGKYDKNIIYVNNCCDRYFDELKVPSVSIIIPVYNTEKYLRRCLDSAIRQTLSDIEIICIDDGSTDHSSEILDEYVGKDSRVRVLHKNNKGYGSAINSGIAEARGKYVAILESDDYVMCNMYEKLYNLALRNTLDMVKAQCYFCWDNINYRIYYNAIKMEKYFNCVLTNDNRDLFFGFLMNTWSGIYNRKFLIDNNIVHHETPGAAYQDNGFWMQTLLCASRAMWIQDPLYLYNQDNEKASTRNPGIADAMIKEYSWIEMKMINRYGGDVDLKKIHYYRLFRHKGNFYRIADEYKLMFIKQIVEDYKKYGYALDDAEDEIKEWYEKLLSDPEKYCENVIKKKNEILDLIDNSKRIYIYEALSPGIKVKRILYSIGRDEKLFSFLQRAPINRNYFGNTPVYSIYDPMVDYDNALILMGTSKSSKYYESIIRDLVGLGCNQFIHCDDIIDNFYWII